MKTKTYRKWMGSLLCGFGLLAALAATGCQSSVGGVTLPSPYYLKDDVQFFPAKSEFKLQEEANAMERYNTDQQLLGN
jgi:hypothetical protein